LSDFTRLPNGRSRTELSAKLLARDQSFPQQNADGRSPQHCGKVRFLSAVAWEIVSAEVR
jgi:hypothetical protein